MRILVLVHFFSVDVHGRAVVGKNGQFRLAREDKCCLETGGKIKDWHFGLRSGSVKIDRKFVILGCTQRFALALPARKERRFDRGGII